MYFVMKLILLSKLSIHFKAQQFFQIHCEYILSVFRHFMTYFGQRRLFRMISWRRLSYFWFWGQGKGHISSHEELPRYLPGVVLLKSNWTWVRLPTIEIDTIRHVWFGLLIYWSVYSYPVLSSAHHMFHGVKRTSPTGWSSSHLTITVKKSIGC